MALKKQFIVWVILLSSIEFNSCSTITYTPRTKHQKQLAKPSVALVENIVHFRETYHEWPLSKEHFISKSTKYKELINGFPYQHIRFKVLDQDRATFYFDQHVKDIENYKNTGQVDLNSYRGEVRFYRANGKFIWKIKMY